jgi:hypothetical protein
MRRVGWGVVLVMRGPLYGVVNFPGLWLWRWLGGVLVHFSLGVIVDGAVFDAVVSFIAMVHAI